MNVSEFSRLLDVSTANAIAFAKTMLLDELPDKYVYRIFPNQSYDGNREDDEIVYPTDSLASLNDYREMTRDDCIRFLYRDGRIAEWIDISVGAADSNFTYVDCRCCGRFTDNDEKLYYNHTNCGPFGIKSPPIPYWTRSALDRPRFSLADTVAPPKKDMPNPYQPPAERSPADSRSIEPARIFLAAIVLTSGLWIAGSAVERFRFYGGFKLFASVLASEPGSIVLWVLTHVFGILATFIVSAGIVRKSNRMVLQGSAGFLATCIFAWAWPIDFLWFG